MKARIVSKCDATIFNEWDAIAYERMVQIDSGVDKGFDEVIAPSILSRLENHDQHALLDVGCGGGSLTALMAARLGRVVGIDPSRANIELAKKFHHLANIEYIQTTAEQSRQVIRGKFDVIVANMVLMDIIHLDEALHAIISLARPGARFYATITDPRIWPHYSGYSHAVWFDYYSQFQVESPFRISTQTLDHVTTHVHRPLEAYIEALALAGFQHINTCALRIKSHAHSDGSRTEVSRFVMLSAAKP